MSGGHSHGTTPGAGAPPDGPVVHHRFLLVVVVLIGLLGIAGMAVPAPQSELALEDASGQGQPPGRLLDGRIQRIAVVDTGLDDPTMLPGALELEVTVALEGGDEVSFPMTDDTGATFQVGQRVKVAELLNDGGEPTYYISDFQRSRPLLLLLALFLAAVIWFGRLQGLRALLGLAATLVLIAGSLVPSIILGKNPILAALSTAAVIMILTLYLSHGFHPKTTAAVIGTAAALALTGLLSWLFVQAAAITGMASEEARMAGYQVGGLSLRGLLLAGIIIGGLGVLDDVTMSQSSTVMELRRANPRAGFRELMRGGIAVGRDHIAATVNTLFLAYAGASLPLLLLFTTSQDTLPDILTSEIVAVELVRTLVGSVGLIAAVPLTTALAAALVLRTAAPELAAGGGEPGEQEPSREQAPLHAAPEDPAVVRPAVLRQDTETDEEWEQRLREAYRLPPPPGQDATPAPD